MNRSFTMGALIAVLVGASLLASPVAAQAKQGGKWWTPKQGGERRVERVYRRDSGRRGFSRQWRTWGDRRVYRDVIEIRANRGPRYRAWRTYCPPEYIYSRHAIRVRPIRFVVAASGAIGGVRFHGSYHGDDYVYGCNFCDARFGSYDSYHAHVQSCGHRPHGYRVECSDWNAPGGMDDGGWRDEDRDGGYYDRSQDRDYDRDYDRNDDRDDRWDRGDVDDDYDR
jgi:hypothetical protein